LFIQGGTVHAESILPTRIRRSNERWLGDAASQFCRALGRHGLLGFAKNVFNGHTLAIELVVDSGIFAISFAAAYLICFEGVLTGVDARQFLVWFSFLLVAHLQVNWTMRVYRFVWKSTCLADAIAVGFSLLLVTWFLLALRLLYPSHALFAAWVRFPLSLIILEFLLSLSGCLGIRVLCRFVDEGSPRLPLGPGESLKRVVLYGAGRAGIVLSRELAKNADIEIVGFVDDDPMKVGTVISGIRVLGTGESLEEIIRRTRADEVVVSVATASPRSLTRILSKCKRIPISAKIIPSFQELLSRKVSISYVRELCIEDLLGRDGVEVGEFDQDVRQAYADQRILITGAGGSIGSELARQLMLFQPHSIAILDKDENSIYELEQELRFKSPKTRIEPVIADVRNRDRLFAILKEFKPAVVFHAAAHKHVPLMEKHPCEAVLNNICGTQNLLEVCQQHGVGRFVFISSDKAVNPTNVMGATKKAGERLVQSYTNGGPMRLACVRFGNVMGSRGSVVPLFQKQIAEGGPLTITHPNIVRFFMTIPEAVQLVLCAGSLASQGEIFVLNMGSPRKILDLAHQMLGLCGLEPGKDIEIAITGLRPGEKMHEELVGHDEQISPTRFGKISKIVCGSSDNHESFFAGFRSLVEASQRSDPNAVYEILSTMGLGFTPSLPFRDEPQRAHYDVCPSQDSAEPAHANI
jgi:FlaA1/EpsC-like NDP-sugar epimerase